MQFQTLKDAYSSGDNFIQGVVWVYDPHTQEISLFGGSTFSRELAQAQTRLAYARAAGFSDAEIWTQLSDSLGNSAGNGLTFMRSTVQDVEAKDAVTAGVQALASLVPLR